jgi:SAM-dependent methyltransferase
MLTGKQGKLMNDRPQTWHYGLVAQHWAEFEVEGLEIAYYQRLIERYGQPALDVACGTGRLLLPHLRAGLDVDGSDISPDMLALCREKAEREGLSPRLYQQAMHELDLPRTYRTIFVCGSFGIGGNRQQDFLALQRFYQHLTPGGVLLLENHVPYGDRLSWQWPYWLRENRQQLRPDFWTEPDRKRASDGSEYAWRSRLADLDPLNQVVTLQTWIQRWHEGQLIAEEEYTLKSNIYFKSELLMMLEQSGFADITVHGDYSEAEATSEHGVLVFMAKKTP